MVLLSNDLDVPKKGEIDGIRYFEENVCKISELKTLVTRSRRGGYHIYYKYCQKITSSIRLNDLNKQVSIDVLSDGKCVFEGDGYELLNCPLELDFLPDTFVELYNREKKRIKREENVGSITVDDTAIKKLLDNLLKSIVPTISCGLMSCVF